MSFRSKVYALYAVLVILYAAITMVGVTAVNAEKFGISLAQYRLVNLGVIVPYFLIWLAGFYGYEKLHSYSMNIKKTKDGKQVNRLAKGIWMFVLWPPLSSIAATGAQLLTLHYPGTETFGIIFNEYFNLVWMLVGFIILSTGARGLSELIKFRPTQRAVHIFALVLITLGTVFTYLVIYAYRDAPNNFRLPLAVVLLTLVVPYVYMWFIGLWSTYQIYLYHRKVAGVIYRKSWRLLGLSVGAIIIMQIIILYANNLLTKFNKISLNQTLAIVTAVLILLSVGYILLARGAKRLQKIEEV